MLTYFRKLGVRTIIATAITITGFLPLPVSILAPQFAHAGCSATAYSPTKNTQGPGYISYGSRAACNPQATTTLNVYLNQWNGGNMIWITSGSLRGTSNFTYYPNSYNCNYQNITRNWVTNANTDGGPGQTSNASSLACS